MTCLKNNWKLDKFDHIIHLPWKDNKNQIIPIPILFSLSIYLKYLNKYIRSGSIEQTQIDNIKIKMILRK